MAESVKGTRSYESPLRRQQAAATRAAMVEAAAELFERDGYARTTLAGVADAAGVSLATVYATFSNKRGLLRAVFAWAAAGGADPRPVVDDVWLEELAAEPDGRQRLALMAARTRGMLDRSAALNEMVHIAASTDPELADLEAEMDTQRRSDVVAMVDALADAGALRLPTRDAVDLVWALATSDLYLRLRRTGRWSAVRADAQIEDLISRTLLE
jgi:AcrR family transcriptional regulator